MVDPQLSLDAGGSSDDVGAFRSLTDTARIYLTLPTGECVGFTFDPQPSDPIGQLETFIPAWRSDDGVEWQLESLGRRLVQAGSGFFVVGTGLPYTPTIAESDENPFTLVSPDGERYSYQRDGDRTTGASYKLASLSAGDVTLRYTDSGLVAPDGTRVTIVRN